MLARCIGVAGKGGVGAWRGCHPGTAQMQSSVSACQIGFPRTRCLDNIDTRFHLQKEPRGRRPEQAQLVAHVAPQRYGSSCTSHSRMSIRSSPISAVMCGSGWCLRTHFSSSRVSGETSPLRHRALKSTEAPWMAEVQAGGSPFVSAAKWSFSCPAVGYVRQRSRACARIAAGRSGSPWSRSRSWAPHRSARQRSCGMVIGMALSTQRIATRRCHAIGSASRRASHKRPHRGARGQGRSAPLRVCWRRLPGFSFLKTLLFRSETKPAPVHATSAGAPGVRPSDLAHGANRWRTRHVVPMRLATQVQTESRCAASVMRLVTTAAPRVAAPSSAWAIPTLVVAPSDLLPELIEVRLGQFQQILELVQTRREVDELLPLVRHCLCSS